MAKSNKPSSFKAVPATFKLDHWERAPKVEKVLDGLDLTYVYGVIDTAEWQERREADLQGGQTQPRFKTDEATVEAYRKAWQSGGTLPALVAGHDLNEQDGLHRSEALKGLEDLIPQVLLIRLDTTPPEWLRHTINTLINNINGLRMSEIETLTVAVNAVVNGGKSSAEAAELFGVEEAKILRRMRVAKARENAKRLGVEAAFSTLKQTVQDKLSTSGLHDGPQRDLIALLAKRPVPVTFADDIIKEVKAQPSDKAAVARIKEYESDLAPKTIPARSNGTKVTPSRAVDGLVDLVAKLVTYTHDSGVSAALKSLPAGDSNLPRLQAAVQDLRDVADALD